MNVEEARDAPARRSRPDEPSCEAAVQPILYARKRISRVPPPFVLRGAVAGAFPNADADATMDNDAQPSIA